jgi:hypothetical protein
MSGDFLSDDYVAFSESNRAGDAEASLLNLAGELFLVDYRRSKVAPKPLRFTCSLHDREPASLLQDSPEFAKNFRLVPHFVKDVVEKNHVNRTIL